MLQPIPIVLVGPCVRMDPLEPHHVDELIAAVRSDPYSASKLASVLVTQDWDAWIAEAKLRVSTGHRVAWAIVRRADERMIGSTGFGDISAVDSCLAKGWTWLAPAARGGHTNAEVKLLQLRWAFETAGAVRVAFQPDSRDMRAKTAKRRVAERDGTFLAHRPPLDGPIRQSAPFFIIAADWEPLRAALSARLNATGCGS